MVASEELGDGPYTAGAILVRRAMIRVFIRHYGSRTLAHLLRMIC